jgi:hypothetical protein
MSQHACRWLYSVADDFFTKQLPHNVTWGLTVLYALDASKDLTNLAVQVRSTFALGTSSKVFFVSVPAGHHIA